MKKYFSICLTILFFTLITSIISPTIAVNGNAATTLPEEDFSATPTAKAKSTPASLSSSPKATGSAQAANVKTTVYKGEISATPSAVGKLLISTNTGEKNVDTDKATRVFIFDKNLKTASTVQRIKKGDNAVAIGALTADKKSLLAKYIFILKDTATQNSRKSQYGVITSREASGTAAFVLQIKNPGKDEKNESYTVNAETTVRVKDIETPKLSDIKIGDRVTFTYYIDEKTNANIITRIFVIPGRAAGLLKEIRDASAAATKQQKEEEKLNATAKPSVRPTTSPKATSAGTTNN